MEDTCSSNYRTVLTLQIFHIITLSVPVKSKEAEDDTPKCAVVCPPSILCWLHQASLEKDLQFNNYNFLTKTHPDFGSLQSSR